MVFRVYYSSVYTPYCVCTANKLLMGVMCLNSAIEQANMCIANLD